MPKPLHILLADDDRDDRYFFEKSLEEVQVKTKLTMVEDGQQLLQFLKENKQQPDVIFLDLNMPRKNGNECLIEIKANKKLENIPVVIYSTSYYDEVADLLYEKGAHYFLQKPNLPELPNAIYKVLSILSKSKERPPRNQFLINTLVAKF